MELIPGVFVHFIPSQQFKTNQITVRFSAPLRLENLAGRMLVSSMLETANEAYPTQQAFRKKLAVLYGTECYTRTVKKGQAHLLDLTFSFVKDDFLSKKNTLSGEVFEFLKACLLSPLTEGTGFQNERFQIEKKKLQARLEAEMDDVFVESHAELDSLFYNSDILGFSRDFLLQSLEKEDAQTAFEIFQRCLRSDRIDFFFIGNFNEVDVLEQVKMLKLIPRQETVNLKYQQTYSNILKEGMKRRKVGQSILEMAYHVPYGYGDECQLSLQVVNALLGTYPNSKLFTQVREKESLAYTISSELDIFSGMMRIYAGIDRKNRNRARKLMNDQLVAIRKGDFTDQELFDTKKMMERSWLLAQDRQDILLERAYLKAILGTRKQNRDSWLEALHKVDRYAVQKVAQNIRLQAIYFMEGVE